MQELLKSFECGHVMRGCAKEDGGEGVCIFILKKNVWCHFDAKRFNLEQK